MTRLIIRLASLLVVLFTGVIVLIQARPYDDSELRAFLLPPEGCPAPCWQGIRPGITTEEDAVRILQSLPWVGYISGTSWQWSSKAPHFVSSEKDWNTLWVNPHNHTVQGIVIVTGSRWGDVWLTYGEPTSIKLDSIFETALPGDVRRFTAWHPEFYLMTHVEIPCIPNHEPFWKARTSGIAVTSNSLEPTQDSHFMSGFSRQGAFESLRIRDCY